MATRSSVAVAFACAIALIGPPSPRRWSERKRRRNSRSPGGERKVSIDNVFGSVHVRAASGSASNEVTVEIGQWAKSRREASLAARSTR
jgi:hypothetical protein